MPASRIAPRVTAWRANNRNLPGIPQGGLPPGGVPFLDAFVPGYTFGARIYPGADTTADPTTWTPVDISAHILQPGDGSQPAITITRGRLDEQQQTGAASCTFTLRNDAAKGNGNYSPRRVTGTYYPYMRAGLPVDVFINNGISTSVRFAGYVEELLPQWDETGNAAFVVVTAYGVWQSIGQGTTPLRSPLYRAISAVGPTAYWSLEDGFDATFAASAITGQSNLALTGSVSFGSGGPAGGAAAVDFSGGGQLTANITGAASGSFEVTFAARVTDTAHDNAFLRLYTSALTIDISFSASFGQLVVGFVGIVNQDHDLPTTLDTEWHLYQVTIAQDGTSVNACVTFDGTTGLIGAPLASTTLGTVKGILLNPGSTVPGAVETFLLSSVAVDAGAPFTNDGIRYTPTDAATVGPAATGFNGETPSGRAARVCGEEGIPFALPAGASSSARTMGAQPTDTLYNILRDCETVEGGVLEDGYNFGLALWTVESRYNQTAAFTPALTQLQPPFSPVENTQRVRNDVTVTLPSGSSGHYAQPSGQPYAVTGAGGVRGRSFSTTMNLDDPNQLINRAAWLVHLGTADADRYGALPVNLAARTSLIASWLAVTNGDRLTVPTTYPTGGQAPDVLVEGWTETLSRFVFGVAVNSAPALPWNVAFVDSATYGRVGSDSTTLAAGLDTVTTGAISINVGALWSVAAGDYPQDFNIGGERITGTITGGSSPQTLTISARSVNGVVRTHNAGDKVDLWLPVVVGV